MLYAKFSNHIKGELEFKNGDETISGVVPVISFTLGMAVISQGISFGVVQDNKNRRVSLVYVFMPQQASVMLDAMVACFNGSHIEKICLYNTVSIANKTYASFLHEYLNCYPIAFTTFTREQYESIIGRSVDIKINEHKALMSVVTQYKTEVNWYDKYVSYTGKLSLVSPGQSDVIMLAFSFLKFNMKAAKFKDNKITGYDGGNLDK